MFDYLLPIGTVVKVKGVAKPLMIIGLLQKNSAGKRFDYNAVLFPEGYISKELNILFQHDEIECVCYPGFDNEDHKALIRILSLLESKSD